MNTQTCTSHVGNVWYNFIEHALPNHPLPWTTKSKDGEFFLVDANNQKVAICDDSAHAQVYADWVNREFSTQPSAPADGLFYRKLIALLDESAN